MPSHEEIADYHAQIPYDILTDDMARMEDVVGREGMPKLVREAIKEKFEELA